MSDEAKGKQAQRIEDLKEIAVVIDSWDDIFSDFDPRPLSERTVSGDFIDELRKRYRETPRGNLVVLICAPQALKNQESEKMVVQRLKRYFRHHFLQYKKNSTYRRIRGVIFVCAGILSLGFLTLATYYKFLSELAIEIAGIILMPLGWFGVWEGFSKLIDTSPAYLHKQELYEKLSKASYQFKYIAE